MMLFILSIAITSHSAELDVFIKDCKSNRKDACYRLGKYYDSIEDYKNVIKPYTIACDKGSPNS